MQPIRALQRHSDPFTSTLLCSHSSFQALSWDRRRLPVAIRFRPWSKTASTVSKLLATARMKPQRAWLCSGGTVTEEGMGVQIRCTVGRETSGNSALFVFPSMCLRESTWCQTSDLYDESQKPVYMKFTFLLCNRGQTQRRCLHFQVWMNWPSSQ